MRTVTFNYLGLNSAAHTQKSGDSSQIIKPMLQGNQGPLFFLGKKQMSKIIKNRLLDYPPNENNNLFFKR